jgi:hypothetical protein
MIVSQFNGRKVRIPVVLPLCSEWLVKFRYVDRKLSAEAVFPVCPA